MSSTIPINSTQAILNVLCARRNHAITTSRAAGRANNPTPEAYNSGLAEGFRQGLELVQELHLAIAEHRVDALFPEPEPACETRLDEPETQEVDLEASAQHNHAVPTSSPMG